MEEAKLKTPGSGFDTSARSKIGITGSHAATPGGKGEKRDATSPPIPPKPVIEKKTREGSTDDTTDTGDVLEEAAMEEEPAYVFSKPTHPNDIMQIVTELRALMLPEIKNIIKENTPDTKTIVFEAVKKATGSFTEKLNTVVKENTTLREKCTSLEKRVTELEAANSARLLENDALEQYGRRNILRISGIPENTSSEDTDGIVLKLAFDMGAPMSPADIDRSHRVGKVRTSHGPGQPTKHRDIIVKFATYNARNRLFQERKFLRETANEELKTIFINEDLTKRRSEILFEARKLRRANKLKSAYSSDGKLIVRDDKDKKYQINELDDLIQFGYVKPTPAAPPAEQPAPSTSGASAMD